MSIRTLKEVHTRTHPARLTAEPAAAEPPVPVDPVAQAELAAELAEEEDELAEDGPPGSVPP